MSELLQDFCLILRGQTASKLSKEQEKEIYDTIVHKTPQDEGFTARMNWTTHLVQVWIKQKYGIHYSLRGTREVLYRLNLRYTVPTYILAKADPQAQKTFLTQFDLLKKKLLHNEIDRILFVDESCIRDYQTISKTWFPKGKQKKIKTFGKHWGTKLIGYLDYESGEVFCIQREKYTAKEFLSFLTMIVERFPNERVVVVLDNARIHHAKLLEPFLKENEEKLSLFYLPPYSPQLNLIEGLWGWLKKAVINNVFFDSALKIHQAVQGFLDHINKNPQEIIDRLCVRL